VADVVADWKNTPGTVGIRIDAFKLKLFRSDGQDNHRISDCADLTFESLAVPM
jgi:hypothetical protein